MIELDLSIDASIEGAEEKDVIQGEGGFGPIPSGVYDCVVNLAYYDEAQSGAIALVLVFLTEDGRKVTTKEYITSGTAKGCKTFYIYKDKKTGKEKKRYLVGFTKMNAFSNLVTNKNLGSLEKEEKTISIYDWESKKEIPKKKLIPIELIGKKVKVGILEQEENKKDANNNFAPLPETKKVNVCDKYFDAETHLTLTETKAGTEFSEKSFINTWKKKYEGKVHDATVKNVVKTSTRQGSNPDKSNNTDPDLAPPDLFGDD